MRTTDNNLSETDIRSPSAVTWTVRADTRDRRPWIVGAPVCPALLQHQIVHLGIAAMPAPFEIVRTKLGGTYFLACFGGEGQVLVDGRWKRCRPGEAFLLPPGTLHAFHTPPGQHWEFCWVRYREAPGQRPLATASSPVLAQFDAEPLRHAIHGLHHEAANQSTPAALDRWVDLIQLYVLRFAQPAEMDRRLSRLWESVGNDLARPWTSAEMARTAHMSEKHLERLCRRELGRTPRQQLIWLRMKRAAELLTDGADKIETVASRVGYQNPFVFSTTFRRCMGWSPSQYPGRVRP